MNDQPAYTIDKIASKAANYMRRLPRKQQEAIAEAFDFLCRQSPFHPPNPTTIKPLKGEFRGLWRYRVGNLRMIYAVNEEARTIQILTIDNRGDVY